MKKLLIILAIVVATSVSAQNIKDLHVINIGEHGGRAATQIQWDVKHAKKAPKYRWKQSEKSVWHKAGNPKEGVSTYGINIQTDRIKDRIYQIRTSTGDKKKVRIMTVVSGIENDKINFIHNGTNVEYRVHGMLRKGLGDYIQLSGFAKKKKFQILRVNQDIDKPYTWVKISIDGESYKKLRAVKFLWFKQGI